MQTCEEAIRVKRVAMEAVEKAVKEHRKQFPSLSSGSNVEIGKGALPIEDVVYVSGDDDDDSSVKNVIQLAKPNNRRGAAVRKRYATPFKVRMLKTLDALHGALRGKGRGKYSILGDITKINKSLLSKWDKDREKIFLHFKKALGKRGRGNLSRTMFAAPRGPPAMFEAAEQMVLARFDQARQKRQAVRARIIRVWMKKAVEDLFPNDAITRGFKASSAWFSRFVCAARVATETWHEQKSEIDSGAPGCNSKVPSCCASRVSTRGRPSATTS